MVKTKKTLKKIIFEEVFVYSWWFFVFLIILYGGLSKVGQYQKQQYLGLQSKLGHLIKTREEALILHNELSAQIQSHIDPVWIEMILKKELGLVPEGYIKVHFTQD